MGTYCNLNTIYYKMIIHNCLIWHTIYVALVQGCPLKQQKHSQNASENNFNLKIQSL